VFCTLLNLPRKQWYGGNNMVRWSMGMGKTHLRLDGFECPPIKPLQSLYTPGFWDGENQVQYLPWERQLLVNRVKCDLLIEILSHNLKLLGKPHE
jgi:hypothetical protein